MESEKLRLNDVEHGFFGRKFGVSGGYFASLNCSKFVGDDESAVFQNLEIVRQKLSATRLVTLNQVHGNLCIEVNSETKQDIKADAMVTKMPGIAIGVLSADCAPILFADEKNKILGAAHAGWKGAVCGVIDATVKKMIELGADIKQTKAAVGPCICKNSYEIDEDFKRNFKGKGDCFCLINLKLHFDLPKYCRGRLLECGLDESNIDVLEIDTYAHPEDYFSFRFANKNSGGVCGRNISVICLKE